MTQGHRRLYSPHFPTGLSDELMRVAIFILLALTFLGRSATAEVKPGQGVRYTVAFAGMEAVADLADLIRQSSALVSKTDDPPPSRAALQRRVDDDIERFESAARSLGYYDAAFDAAIQPASVAGEPMTVTVTVEPGQAYRIALVEFRTADDAPLVVGAELPAKRIGLAAGAQARAADVVSAQTTALRILHERGYPLAEAGKRTVLIDRDATEMRVTFRFTPGPAARLGPVSVSGAETVDPGFVLRRLPWRFGESADIRKIEDGRRNLASTGVFDTVDVRFGDAVDAEGLIPVQVSVTERAPRSIGAGVSASTSEGLGVNAFWTHRNLFGGAERLDVNGRVSEVETHVTGDLRLPDVILNDQDLVLSSGLVQESTDSYDSQKVSVGGRFERRVNDILTVDYGAVLERSLIDEGDVENRYTLVGLPVGATIDTSDDLLNPTRGGRSRVRFTPYLEYLGSTISFYSMTARHAHYIALDDARDFILAGRAAIGSILGASTNNIPADKRLYSGGSGSVRGYGLQKIGPLDGSGDPTGGRSMVEVGAELRWRVHGDFGIVPFIDGGQVYDTETPDLGQELQWAAGLGFRYYTPIGPIRADIAFPLNPRSSDDRFQVYFSLGQAF